VNKNSTLISLAPEESHYLKNVLRLEKGEKVSIFNGKDPEEFIAIIKESSKQVKLEVIEIKKDSIKKNYFLALAFGIIKGKKTDFIIQKATEIGIDALIPFESERTIVNINRGEKEKKRILRWEKIIIGANKQCERNVVPKITSLKSFSDLISMTADYDSVLVASPGKNKQKLKPIAEKNKKILLVVGPEGGFSEKELAFFKETGSEFFSLGTSILRAETAAIVASAIVKCKIEGLI